MVRPNGKQQYNKRIINPIKHTTMKKIMLSLTLALVGITQMFALSTSSVRNHARFLSDRMAYELDLSASQYDDVFEINFDYIYQINRIMDDVVYGYRDAIDKYYDLLDDRNDDLRYVLTNRQYQRFIAAEYFYRPVYSTGRIWEFRVYTIYSNRTFFYYDAPRHYKTYIGEHSRVKYGRTVLYYSTRYERQHHDRYAKPDFRISVHTRRDDIRRNDFGANVRIRNNSEQNKVNNYKNANSSNRTSNKYYRDNSGNHNAQEINRRNNHSSNSNQGNGNNSSSTTTSKGRSGSSANATNNNNGNSTRNRSNTSSSSTSTRGGSTSNSTSNRR